MRTSIFGRSRALALTTVAVMSGAVMAAIPSAQAIGNTTYYTVTTANAGGGSGCTGLAPNLTCQTLTDALTAANAQDGMLGEDIVVKFDASLDNATIAPAYADRMTSVAVGGPGLESVGFLGALYVVQQVHSLPVTVDFGNEVGIVSADDLGVAGVWINSTDVTIKNATNLRAGEAGVAISAANATVSGSTFDNLSGAVMEAAISLINGADHATLINDHIVNPVVAGVYVAPSYVPNGGSGVIPNLVDDLSISGLLSDEGTNIAFNAPYADVMIASGAYVDGFDMSGSLLANPYASLGHLSIQQDSTTDVVLQNATIDDNTFTNPVGGGSVGVHAWARLDEVTFSDNTFNSMVWGFDDGIYELSNLTFQGNIFNGTQAHDLLFDQALMTELLVDNNAFLDETLSAKTSVWINYQATNINNVISNNDFVMTPGNYPVGANHRWAIWGNTFAAAQGTSAGWSIVDNNIDGYGIPGTEAPIALGGTGAVEVKHNTFVNVQGSASAADTEAGAGYFLWNNGTNNRIQTWRVAQASFSPTEIAVTVAPVNPAENGLVNLPVGPVSVDVYWTATDEAEVYLGSIKNLSAMRTKVFSSMVGPGYIRIQTHDALGQSSQYSTTTLLAPSTPPQAPVVNSIRSNGVVTGHGEPGNTVRVYDARGHVVGTGVVRKNGTFVVKIKNPRCGMRYVAVQFNAMGQPSKRSNVAPPACAPGPPHSGLRR